MDNVGESNLPELFNPQGVRLVLKQFFRCSVFLPENSVVRVRTFS